MEKGSKKENGKTRHIDIRLTEIEYQEITKFALQEKKTKSQFVLSLIEEYKKNKQK